MTTEATPGALGSNEGVGVMVPERDRWSERYQVVRRGFWWRVKIGDGEQSVGRCYTEMEAQRLAANLMRAFRDGYYAAGMDRTQSGMTLAPGLAEQLGHLMSQTPTGRPVPFA